jgi:YbgC/YbaW family acyl-CoA thioester hydrolase
VLNDDRGGPLSVVRRRVAMADVDAAQILYFTSPFRWFEAQVTELMADRGHPLSEVLRSGVGMPVVNTTCEYLLPVSLDDVVEQTLLPGPLGTTSFGLACEIELSGRLAVRVTSTYVWGEREGADHSGPFRPAKVPDWIRELFGLAE